MGLRKTLEEYIKMYEKHTKEKFQFNTGFSFFYHPEHGFCEYKIEDTGLYIWQLCGDLNFIIYNINMSRTFFEKITPRFY